MTIIIYSYVGNIDDVYGHCESDFGQVDMPWYIRDPHSEFSAVWDLTQVVFLIYVSWTVPLRACFGLETELFSYVWLLDTVVDVYFLTDLGLNFATAYYDVNGVREGRVGFITKRYLKGWFSIDFVSCIPINYITMAMESSEDGDSNFRAFKVLRLFRLSKMLRLARIQRILQRYEELEFVQNYAGMGGLLFVIIIMAHILACVWYAIGLDDTHFHLGRQTPGWGEQFNNRCCFSAFVDNHRLHVCDSDSATDILYSYVLLRSARRVVRSSLQA